MASHTKHQTTYLSLYTQFIIVIQGGVIFRGEKNPVMLDIIALHVLSNNLQPPSTTVKLYTLYICI